jgi:hypothetical protein
MALQVMLASESYPAYFDGGPGSWTRETDSNRLSPYGDPCWHFKTSAIVLPTDITEGGFCGWFAFNNTGFGSSYVALYESGVQHCAVGRHDTAEDLFWQVGPGAIQYDTNFVFSSLLDSNYQWNWWECEWKIADSGGYFNVWIDGVQKVQESGDTRNGGTSGTVNEFRFLVGVTGENSGVTDLFIWDKTGTTWTSRPDAVRRALPLLPNATSESDWSLTGAATHHEALDEGSLADGDTTNVTSASVNDRERLGVESYDGPSTGIIGVAVEAGVKATGASTDVDVGLRELDSGNNSEAVTSHTVDGSYTLAQHFSLVNPDTASAWTATELDSGVQIVLEQK